MADTFEGPLSRQFLEAWSGSTPSPRDLEEGLVALIGRCRDRWPGVTALTDEEFAGLLPACLSPSSDLTTDLAQPGLAEVFLTAASARQDPAALAAFDTQYLRPAVADAVGRARAPSTLASEVEQRLRCKLLLPEGKRPPRIATFSGKGPLLSWLKTAAARTLTDLKRTEGQLEDDELLLERAAEGNPELETVKGQLASKCREAFREALATLEPWERNVLRLHFVDGLNIDRIGQLYDVHRATVARWVARLRSRVQDCTRERRGTRLHLSQGSLDQVLNTVWSRLDVSLGRLLDEPGADG